MKKQTKKKAIHKRKFIVLLSNNTDHRDDDSVEVWAKTHQEAISLAQYDRSRFSIKTALTVAEAKKNWA